MDKLSRGYTDSLKVISALLVVIGHYASSSIIHGWSTSPIWYVLASQCGYIGVAVFFFLSGYGLSESDKKHHLSINEFIKKRFLKIYKPVLLVTAIWLTIEYTLMRKSIGWHIFYDMFWGFDDGVLWFVKILFGLYAAFFIFSQFCNNDRYKAGWSILILSSIILMYIANITDGYSSIAIPCFTLGVFYSRSHNQWHTLTLMVVALCCSVVYTMITKDNHGLHAAINYSLLIAAILIFNKVQCVRYTKMYNSKCIALCGVISFDLYLTHFKVMESLIYYKCYFGGVILLLLYQFVLL